MYVGIVSSLALLIGPLGAPPPAPAETPPVNMSTQATICNKYCDARDPRSGRSRRGHPALPSGQRGGRTQMYSVGESNGRGVGALGACGTAGDRAGIACTPWARTPGSA